MKAQGIPQKQIGSGAEPDRRRFMRLASAGMVTVAGASFPSAWAQAQNQVTWKAVINHRNGAQFKKWQWLQTELPKRSAGRLQLEIATVQELGLTGTELLRVMKTGLIDIAEVQSGYVAGDFPMIEATDLPGMSASYQETRKMYDAWFANVVAKNEDIMAGKPLSTFAWNSIYLFSKFPLNSLQDLKGKRIRNFSPSQARYLSVLGAEPVSIPIADVFSALQRGVIDGCLTGPDQVKGMSIYEVTRYISNLSIAPSGSYIVVGRKSWDKLPADLQKLMLDIAPQLTDLGWSLGEENNREGLELAREKGMSVAVDIKPELQPVFKKIAAEEIVPWWGKRVGTTGKDAFNQHLASLTGFKI